MNDRDRNESDSQDDDVRRLLGRVEPGPSMPAEVRHRVLDTLLRDAEASGAGAGAAGRPPRRGLRVPAWLAAAAAVLFGVLIWIWPGGTGSRVAWADVASYLETPHAVAARFTILTDLPGGEVETRQGRLFQRDPGLSRSDLLPAAADDPERERPVQVTITHSSTEGSTIARLSPAERTARVTVLEFGSRDRAERETAPGDLVSGMWTRLRELASDDARRIGVRRINGARAEGFEIDAFRLVGAEDASGPRPDARLRVWADTADAVPLEIELEGRDPAGRRFHTRFHEIHWDARLDDILFELPDPDTWTISEERVRQVTFEKTRLRPGVTLRIGPETGEPLLTESDIDAVISGSSVRDGNGGLVRLTLFARATPEAGERLSRWTADHPGATLIVDFDGRVRYTLHLGGVIDRDVRFDITPLGISPDEFEHTYLEP